jgi:hypothetical protein
LYLVVFLSSAAMGRETTGFGRYSIFILNKSHNPQCRKQAAAIFESISFRESA